MNEDPTRPRSTADLAYGKEPSTEQEELRARDADTPAGDRSTRADGNSDQMPLLDAERSRTYSERWQTVQANFVDEPQEAVREADGLVAEVIQTLATSFADQRRGLEEQWSRGSEVSTEDLRQALMQYRSFFQRLLAA